MLYDHYVFDIPRLMDICALYGHLESDSTVNIVQTVFVCQRKYCDDLKESFRTLFDVSYEPTFLMCFTYCVDFRYFPVLSLNRIHPLRSPPTRIVYRISRSICATCVTPSRHFCRCWENWTVRNLWIYALNPDWRKSGLLCFMCPLLSCCTTAKRRATSWIVLRVFMDGFSHASCGTYMTLLASV